jgi:hypothetical protein
MPAGDTFAEGGLMQYFRFCDSFDHLDQETAWLKYGQVSGTYTYVAGPFYGRGARFTGSGNWLDHPPADRDASNVDTTGASRPFVAGDGGVHLQLSPPAGWGTLPGGAPVPAVVPVAVVAYDRPGAAGYAIQNYLEVRANGSVALRTPSSLLGESAPEVFPFPLPGGTAWVHVEYRVKLKGDGSGLTEVYLNGTLVCNSGGLGNLDSTEEATHYRVGNIQDGVVGVANTAVVDADDLFWVGADPPDPDFPETDVDAPGPFGPIGVRRVPLAEDVETNLLAAGGSHFEQVDDPVPDFDSSTVDKTLDEPLGDYYLPGPWPTLPDEPEDRLKGLCAWYTALGPVPEDSPYEWTVLRAAWRWDRPWESPFPAVLTRDWNLFQDWHCFAHPADGAAEVMETIVVGAGWNGWVGPDPTAHAFSLTQLAVEYLHANPAPVPTGGALTWAFFVPSVP